MKMLLKCYSLSNLDVYRMLTVCLLYHISSQRSLKFQERVIIIIVSGIINKVLQTYI